MFSIALPGLADFPLLLAQAADAASPGASLVDALVQISVALWDVLWALLGILVPWSPLLAWIAFWLFAVRWVRLREVLAQGGWIGVVLLGAVAVMIWGEVSPTQSADFLGLRISNYVEKLVYVSGLICLMFLAGAVQLSGALAGCCGPDDPILIAEGGAGEHDHGHGPDSAHGHDAPHGHDGGHH